MFLEHFWMLIHELLNKDPDIIPEEGPIIYLYSNFYVCMDKNRKDTNITRHVPIIVHFVRNGKKLKMHKIDWCEGGMQLADIVTNNFGDNYLNPRMKYIMVRLDN